MSAEGERRRRELHASTPAEVDLVVFAICRALGHCYEGRVVDVDGTGYCVGRCQMCGIGAMTDGT